MSDFLFNGFAPNANRPLESEEVPVVERAVAVAFGQVLDALLIDITDPHAQKTAQRYAKMMVQETCRGRFTKPPELTAFPNTKQLDECIVVGPIAVRSLCAHHFCPVVGNAWVGYIPGEKEVIGLSKFSRVVDWFARRPQVQEEMVKQIADFLEENLKPKALAVLVDATHMCMTWRGVEEHPSATMSTSVMRGAFRDKPEARQEFFALVRGR